MMKKDINVFVNEKDMIIFNRILKDYVESYRFKNDVINFKCKKKDFKSIKSDLAKQGYRLGMASRKHDTYVLIKAD